MKVLGEKSLSSKVENGLKVLFCIIALVDTAVLLIGGLTLFLEYNSSSIIANYLYELILLTIVGCVFLLTGVVALFIIAQFIKIFNNLKNNKLFEKDNIVYLNKVSVSSIIIGILYLFVLIGASAVLGKYISFGVLSDILIKVLLIVFAIAFIILGIGIRVLNEIYKKAVDYKNENDFTI